MTVDNENLDASPAWNATDHIRAAAAEVLAAERIHNVSDVPGDVCWLGGNNAAIDIIAVIDGESVHADAKCAFFETRRPDAICWMGREGNAIPEATTHLALVLLDDRTDVRVTNHAADPADLGVTGRIGGDVYLVPRAIALTAMPAMKLDGTVGAGRNVGLRLADISAFLLPQGATLGQSAA